MGVVIKTEEARQGMKNNVSKQNEVLRSVLVHVVSAFICALVFCYSYWFYCFINHFVWIYLPNIWPVVFGPKCIFVVANVIVVVVVGDWRQTYAKSRNIHDDMYDEYERRLRSRGPRRVLVYKKTERKQYDAVKKTSKALDINKVEVVKQIVEEKEEEIVEEMNENKEDSIVETSFNKIFEEANEKTAEENKNLVKNTRQIQKSAHGDDIKDSKETIPVDYGQNRCIKKSEVTRSTDDDLDDRVETFIARVNRRRWAEAEDNNLLIRSA